MSLLCIENLRTYFETSGGVVKAVDGVSLSIAPGEVLGLVGESGSGKSVLAMSILRLIPEPPGRIVGGRVLWCGFDVEDDLVQLPKTALRRIRGKEIAMIFQEPMTALNPVMTIGRQIAEVEPHVRGEIREVDVFYTESVPDYYRLFELGEWDRGVFGFVCEGPLFDLHAEAEPPRPPLENGVHEFIIDCDVEPRRIFTHSLWSPSDF